MSRRLLRFTEATAPLSALNDALTLTPADTAPCKEFGIYIEFNSSAAAGTVLVETASNASYAGTWAVLGTVNWAAGSKCHFVGITDAIAALRIRVSSAITSGSATVTVVGNV